MLRKRTAFVLMMALAGAFSARAADSVFLEGAFTGTWRLAIRASSGNETQNVLITPVPENQGPALLNSLGDNLFHANNCPPITERREYYKLEDAETFAYGCTNGSSFIFRFREQVTGETGVIRITQTSVGPPATFSGSGSATQTASIEVTATYQSGGIATPLGRVPDDSVTLLSTNPPQGTTLTPGETVNLNTTVTYRMNAHRNGTIQAVLVSALPGEPGKTVDTSPAFTVGIQGGEQQRTFSFSNVQVPASRGLSVRVFMIPNSTGTVSASVEAPFPVYVPPPIEAIPDFLSFRTLEVQESNCTLRTTFCDIVVRSPRPFTATVKGRSTWLGLGAAGVHSLASSQMRPYGNEPGAVLLSVVFRAAGLVNGDYADVIELSDGQSTVSVPAVMNLDATEVIHVFPTAFRIRARQGQGSSTPYKVAVSAGNTWSARVVSGADLIQLTSANSSVASIESGESVFVVSLASGATNQLGVRYAVIEVSSPLGTSYVTVVVEIQPVTAATQPEFGGLQWVEQSYGQVGIVSVSSNVASRTFTFHISDTTSQPASASVTTDSSGSWLSATANTSVSTQAPGQITLTATRGALVPGTYRGTLSLTVGNATRTLGVTYFVIATASSAIERREAGCVPSRVVIFSGTLTGFFSSTAGWPEQLAARLEDDCGNPLTTGSVTASFNTGDRPLILEPDGSGFYFATWTPISALLGTTRVTLRAFSGDLTPGETTLSGNVSVNTTKPPALVANGIIQNLNPTIGGPLAQGTVVQVYGSNLAAGTQQPSSLPLPTSVQGAELLVGGYLAPLYYASKEMLVAQLPAELQAGRSYAAIVTANGAVSTPQMINVIRATPGVAAYADGGLIAQHLDYQLVTAANPAKAGESLIMYLVGMGATNPTVPAGQPTPYPPLHEASLQPTVTVGGQPAQVQFAGLTPGGVGLHQINFVVPAGVGPGDLEVVIRQGTLTANVTKLPVR